MEDLSCVLGAGGQRLAGDVQARICENEAAGELIEHVRAQGAVGLAALDAARALAGVGPARVHQDRRLSSARGPISPRPWNQPTGLPSAGTGGGG